MGLCCDTNVRVCDAPAFSNQVDANPSATIFTSAERPADIIQEDYKDEITKHKTLKTRATTSYNSIQNMKDYSRSIGQNFKKRTYECVQSTRLGTQRTEDGGVHGCIGPSKNR
ncbi:unnamed protein product [Rotaria sordida]|uniref:Uncharacterized protein n=1 Tax=Rotaria sordida TaxID=392033 RepID=A0A814VWJ1_9BILA|nr:unnamed protein product [Rotaria sordida]